MKPSRSYSAISYVAAVLIALSGPIAAAPADVSGATEQQLPQFTQNAKQGVFLALQEHPLTARPVSTKPGSLSVDSLSAPVPYDTGAIDELQEKLDAELNTLIELQGL